jgi:hypothetical protein
MDPLVHYPDQPISQSTESTTCPTQPCACPCGTEPRAPTCPQPSQSALCASIEPVTPRASRLHVTQPFSMVAQSFYYIVRHFAIMNLAICWSELSHFVRHSQNFPSVICCSELSHFLLLCLVIF